MKIVEILIAEVAYKTGALGLAKWVLGHSENPTARALAARTLVVAPVGPANVTPPEISGILTAGQTLTCSAGVWSGYPAPTLTYQWKRGAAAISGATAATYLLQDADAGQSITCTVTATNSTSSASRTTTSVTPAARLTLSGTVPATATVGVAYSFTPTSTGGHTPKVFGLPGLPAWLALVSATGQITGTPGVGDVGTFSGTMTVTDADGLTATLAINITAAVAAYSPPLQLMGY